MATPLKTNMEPENTSLEDDSPIERGDLCLSVPAVSVLYWGGSALSKQLPLLGGSSQDL